MDLGSSSEMPKYIKHNEGEREYRNKIAMKRRGRSGPQGIAKGEVSFTDDNLQEEAIFLDRRS